MKVVVGLTSGRDTEAVSLKDTEQFRALWNLKFESVRESEWWKICDSGGWKALVLAWDMGVVETKIWASQGPSLSCRLRRVGQ